MAIAEITNAQIKLTCPHCRERLTETHDRLECAGCSARWPVVEGIPYFVAEAPYWGERGLTPEVMREINAQMPARSWHAIMREHPLEAVRERYEIISEIVKETWPGLGALAANKLVLDLGAGLGNYTQIISPHAKHIYAVDRVEERVQFMQKRFQEEGCRNITVVRSDVDSLPFPEGSFDLIILNGVLEWLPFSRKKANPREAQIYYLRTMRKLLSASGTIYIGIENRMSYDYLRGGMDQHVSLKYVAVLPRFLADVVCKRKMGDRYRPYQYTSAGYKRLLRDAGYREAEVYSAFPSYILPKKVVSLRESSIHFAGDVWRTKNRVNLWAKSLLIRLDLLKYFGFAYIILARK